MLYHDSSWWTYLKYDEDKVQPGIDPNLLWRVWEYANHYRLKMVALLVTVVIITGLNLIPPLLYRDLIDVTLPAKNMTRLNWLALGMISVPFLQAGLELIQRFFSASIGEHVIADLRNTLFEHMHTMSLRFFTHAKTGKLMSRLNDDVVGAQQALTGTFIIIITDSLTVISTLMIMFFLEWRLTILSVILLPLFIIPTRNVGRKLRLIRHEGMALNAKMNALMNETLNINGALLVKVFGQKASVVSQFKARTKAVGDIGLRTAMLARRFFLGLGIANSVGTALVFWVGGYLVLQGSFSTGTIIAFGAYLVQLYHPLSGLSNAYIEIVTSLVSFERVFEILDIPPEITDDPNSITLEKVQGNVVFDNVSFNYQIGGDGGVRKLGLGIEEFPQLGNLEEAELIEGVIEHEDTLKNISFSIKPGQLVAIVGPSGSGKTTLTNLLFRLYNPTQGEILLDGYKLSDISLQSLTDAVGIVTQETYLFHDTLRANLLCAKPDASESELMAACQAANIYEFINNLPDGYETIVGEHGYSLSGGQRQRLALARAILKNPAILILDEATSHLDTQSEALVQEALTSIMDNRTSIVIAHRLSTIIMADIILVLNQGRLVAQAEGTAVESAHEILLTKNDLYAKLYRAQFDKNQQIPTWVNQF